MNFLTKPCVTNIRFNIILTIGEKHMKEAIRYSSSALTAIVLSFITFLAMTWLINTPKHNKFVSVDPIEFTMIADMDITEPNKPTPPRTPPKQEQVKKPPAAPKFDISEVSDPTPGLRMPTGIGKPKFAEITQWAKPDVFPSTGKPGTSQNLVALLPIMPNYPLKERRNQIEGWVKVEFVVNELGNAVNIKVIDSKPKHVFNQETIRAIRKSKFKPLIIDGKAISQTAVQVIEFKLQE